MESTNSSVNSPERNECEAEECPEYTGSTPRIQEEQNSDKAEIQTRSEPLRFYIIIVYSLLVFTQGAVWNTWGPISDSANYAFGWTDHTIILMSNWGCITYIISTLFFAWLADVKGARISCVLTGALVAAGCGVRCITSTPPTATWLIHIGQFLNGLGGPIAMGGPPLLSALWFPVHQRTSATALMTVSAGVGVGISFIIAPLLVPDVGENWQNATNVNVTVGEVRHSIMRLMYIEFAWSAVIFLALCIYFPTRPSVPPSVTATVTRVPFKPAVFRLVRNYRFWMLSLPYAISNGVWGVWGSVLDVNLKQRDISQHTAGWLGFWMTMAAQVAGLIAGIFADIFAKRMKVMISVAYVIGALSFLAFTLMYYKVFKMNIAVLYVTNIVTSACIDSSSPLLFELICESCFPVAEGITNIFMTSLNNLFGLFFLLIPYVTTDNSWMNWVMLGAIVICIPIFALFPENYQRFDIDTVAERETDGEEDDHETSRSNIQTEGADTSPLLS